MNHALPGMRAIDIYQLFFTIDGGVDMVYSVKFAYVLAEVICCRLIRKGGI